MSLITEYHKIIRRHDAVKLEMDFRRLIQKREEGMIMEEPTVVLFLGASQPKRTECAEAREVVVDCEVGAGRLPDGQRSVHLLQCLLPQVIRLP